MRARTCILEEPKRAYVHDKLVGHPVDTMDPHQIMACSRCGGLHWVRFDVPSIDGKSRMIFMCRMPRKRINPYINRWSGKSAAIL